MQLDAKNRHNPDPDYLRALLRRSRLSQRQAAEVIGMPLRTLELNLKHGTKYPADYRTQFALEWLAERQPAMVAGVDDAGASPATVAGKRRANAE